MKIKLTSCTHHPLRQLCLNCAKENALIDIVEERDRLRAALASYLSKHCACCRRGNQERERDEKAKEALNGVSVGLKPTASTAEFNGS